MKKPIVKFILNFFWWGLVFSTWAWSFYHKGARSAFNYTETQFQKTFINYVNVPRDSALVNIGERRAYLKVMDYLLDRNK